MKERTVERNGRQYIELEDDDGRRWYIDVEKAKGLQIFCCSSEDMLVGLVPDPEEQQREHDAFMDAKFPQTRCDVCQENTGFLVASGGVKVCQGCVTAEGVTYDQLPPSLPGIAERGRPAEAPCHVYHSD